MRIKVVARKLDTLLPKDTKDPYTGKSQSAVYRAPPTKEAQACTEPRILVWLIPNGLFIHHEHGHVGLFNQAPLQPNEAAPRVVPQDTGNGTGRLELQHIQKHRQTWQSLDEPDGMVATAPTALMWAQDPLEVGPQDETPGLSMYPNLSFEADNSPGNSNEFPERHNADPVQVDAGDEA